MPNTLTDSGDARWTVPAWQLPIAQLCDSAAPTGAFSHSFGLETYVLESTVTDGPGFASWLRAMIKVPLSFGDGLAIRLVSEATADPCDLDAVWWVDRVLHAAALPRQVRDATVAMGGRMLAIARQSSGSAWLDAYAKQIAAGGCFGHPAVAVGLAGAELKAPVGALIGAYLQSVATSLTQNAVRLIPLGQNAGQAALASVRGDIASAVERIAAMSPLDLGSSAAGLEVSQMRHERIRARMYMS